MTSENKNWQLYIIRTKAGQLYTGVTVDLERRFREHVEGKQGAKFFRRSPAQEVVFRTFFASRSEAQQGESFVKRLSRKQKKKLIGLSS